MAPDRLTGLHTDVLHTVKATSVSLLPLQAQSIFAVEIQEKKDSEIVLRL